MFVYLTATSQQEEQHGDGWDSLHGSCGPLPIDVDSCVLVQCSLHQGRSSSSLSLDCLVVCSSDLSTGCSSTNGLDGIVLRVVGPYWQGQDLEALLLGDKSVVHVDKMLQLVCLDARAFVLRHVRLELGPNLGCSSFIIHRYDLLVVGSSVPERRETEMSRRKQLASPRSHAAS